MANTTNVANNLQAICNSCNKLAFLDLWHDTNQLLCRKCTVEYFEHWRKLKIRECYEIDSNLEVYKKRIDNFNPVLLNNLETIKNAHDQIEAIYSSYITLLNNEKLELMTTLEHLKKEKFDDNVISSLVKQFNQSNEMVHKANQSFLSLTARPIKVLEKFDKMALARADIRYIGKIYTKDTTLVNQSHQSTFNTEQSYSLSNLAKTTDIFKETTRHLSAAPVSRSFGIGERLNNDNFKVWSSRTDEMPYEEITINKMPLHLTSHRNYLFCVDDEDFITQYAVNTTNNFEFKNCFKLSNFTNIRGIAANLDYFAITYSDLPKKYLKNKKYKPSGAVLFKRDTADIIQIENEKMLAVDIFKTPVGIALNNEYAFVCDKELRCIFKIDIRTNNLIKKVDISGEPFKISINRNYMVVTDCQSHSLNIFEIETLAMLNNLYIEQADGKNGPFGVIITEDNIIFAKNYAESQLTLFNFNLNDVYPFKKIKSNIHGFAMLQCYNQILVVGIIEKKNVFKLICYSNVNN